MTWVASPACLAIAKEFEALRCSAYLDPVGIPTIGYGHTRNVQLGDSCSPEQADEWLVEDFAHAAANFDPYVSVLPPLSQPQQDALLDAVFNIGPGCPEGLNGMRGRDGIIWLEKRNAAKVAVHSTLFRHVLQGQFSAAADEFLKWNHANGTVMLGLTRRREAERELFLSGMVKT